MSANHLKMGDIMTDETVAKNILNQNAEEYEVKEVKSLAMIGVYIAILNLGFNLVPLLVHGAFSIDLVFSLAFILGIVGLSWQTSKFSLLAAKLLFGSMAGLLAIRFAGAFVEEEVNYTWAIMVAVVSLLILGKMYPGLGSARELSHKDEGKTAIVYSSFALVAVVLILNIIGLLAIVA